MFGRPFEFFERRSGPQEPVSPFVPGEKRSHDDDEAKAGESHSSAPFEWDPTDLEIYRLRRALDDISRQLSWEIKERIRTEHQLERTSIELRSSRRELQEFAHIASHDLLEPLRKISSFADLLRIDFGDKLGTKGLAHVDRIQESAVRLTSLLKDLWHFSQIRLHVGPFERVSLNEEAGRAIADLVAQFRDVEGEIDVADLPEIDADPALIRHMLQILIGNALKFRRRNTRARVSIVAEESTLHGRAACRLKVEDNGIGFDEKYADRIFVPFQRLHDRSAFKGAGMGLAICRRIVERHHGEITAVGRPDEGALFEVTLPIRQLAAEADR